MKKMIALAMLVCMCGAALFAQKYTIVRTEKNVTLPDGAVGDLSFFKKHSDLSNYAKHTRPQDKKTIYWTTAISVKDEKELGDFHKTYKENENETVRKICELHKETDSKYSLAWVDLGDIVIRAVFMYKNGKPTYDRLNYFDEHNKIYMAYLEKKNAKEEKINKTVESVVGTVLGSSTNSITSNSNAREIDAYNNRPDDYIIRNNANGPASITPTTTTTVSQNAPATVDHEKNRTYLSSFFNKFSAEGGGSSLSRTKVTDTELNYYEDLLQKNVSPEQAARSTYNAYRK